MSRPQRLDDAVLSERLPRLDGWTLDDGKLTREFNFRDFNEAFGFMARAALIAERLDHHPEWFNVYATVRVQLTTHDAGGISDLDFTLAEAMNHIADER
jgi:4a-hydroxytetrahydrobiopterin dehydratase